MDAPEPRHATTSSPSPDGKPRTVDAAVPDSLQGIAWRLLTSPTTLLALGVLMGLYLTWAAFIPSDLTHTQLATAEGFGVAEITTGLGADHPIAGWPFWLLCLLAALHLVARLLSPRDSHAGLAVSVTVASAQTPDALVSQLGALAPRKSFFRADDGKTLIFKQGAPSEAAVAIALGLVALALSFVLNKDRSLDAELTVTTGDLTGETARSTVNLDGNIIERALPFRLVCDAPDPLDAGYTIGCLFAGPESFDTPGTAVILRPGTSTEIEGYRLTPRRAGPAPRTPEAATSLLLQPAAAGSAPTRVVIPAGQTVVMGDATKTSLSAGVLGGLPWVRMARGEGDTSSTTLLLPSSLDGAPSELSILHAERLTVRVESLPPRWLFWLGLGLVIIGLGLWVAIADLTFTARLSTNPGEPAVTRVTISSLNRPARLAAWVAAVADGPREPKP